MGVEDKPQQYPLPTKYDIQYPNGGIGHITTDNPGEDIVDISDLYHQAHPEDPNIIIVEAEPPQIKE